MLTLQYCVRGNQISTATALKIGGEHNTEYCRTIDDGTKSTIPIGVQKPGPSYSPAIYIYMDVALYV